MSKKIKTNQLMPKIYPLFFIIKTKKETGGWVKRMTSQTPWKNNKRQHSWTGEMVQWLIPLTVKNWVQYPAPTRYVSPICNSSSRGYDAFFWPLLSLHAHWSHTYTQTHTDTWNKINNFLKKKSRVKPWQKRVREMLWMEVYFK